jgi:hypothetical protein
MEVLLHFKMQNLKLHENSTKPPITGYQFNGQPIEGTDTMNIVPKGEGK